MKDISVIIGKKIKSIDLNWNKTKLSLYCEDGSIYSFELQDQASSAIVWLEDVAGGELEDLIGETIIDAKKSQRKASEDEMAQSLDNEQIQSDSSLSWTFFNIDTMTTSLTIRWNGSSNGHYSEDVGIYEIKEAP